MAYGDNTQVWTDLDYGLAAAYNMRAKAMFQRQGVTAKWFRPRGQVFEGEKYIWEAFTQPSSGVLSSSYTTARAGVMPAARDLSYTKLSVTTDDLFALRGTVKVNEFDVMRTKGEKLAVANLAMKVLGDLDADFGSSANAKLFQGKNSVKAEVHTFYNVAGTSSGDTATGYDGHTAMFIRIKNGSVSQFSPGEVLGIYDASNSYALCNLVKVWDVIYGYDGPPVSGARQPGIGPGLVCEPCDADGAVYASAWAGGTMSVTGTSASPAAGDHIARYGEYTTDVASSPTSHPSLYDFFDTTVDIYRNEGGTLQDREAAGNGWMNPEVVTIAAAGSEVLFDPEVHLRFLEDYWPNRIATARVAREKALSGDEESQGLPSTLLGICHQEIVNAGVDASKGTERFTAAARLDEATKRALWGEIGFEGFVMNSPSLPTITFQPDVACRPYKILFADPRAFFYVTFGGQKGRLNWVGNDSGGKWHVVPDSGTSGTSRLTLYRQASAWTLAGLVCDAPMNVAQISGVKGAKQ